MISISEKNKRIVSNLEPKSFWNHFYEISLIPRGSKNEFKMSDYLESFVAKQSKKGHQILFIKDQMSNVIIRVKANCKKYEKIPVICLQAHQDMVNEKLKSSKHDFEKDPIELVKKGNVLTANGTTLGADNSTGICCILSILEDDNFEHGEIECLFTVQEEIGLVGAVEMDSKFLTAKYLLNLDCSDSKIITVGCSGGFGSVMNVKTQTQKKDEKLNSFLLEFDSLLGGHSGRDIHLIRGNSVKLIFAFLEFIRKEKFEFSVSEVNGGDKTNAIPRESSCIINFRLNELETFKTLKNKFLQTEIDHIKKTESKFIIEITEINIKDKRFPVKQWTNNFLDKVIILVNELPHGVIRKNDNGQVENSTNFSKFSTQGEEIHLHSTHRSVVDEEMVETSKEWERIGKKVNGIVSVGVKLFKGWKPSNPENDVTKIARKVFSKIYKNVDTHYDPVMVVHAGIECGVLHNKKKDMQCISFGCDVLNCHTPDELVKINTVNPFVDFTHEMIYQISEKEMNDECK